jgi:hypothetical protein
MVQEELDISKGMFNEAMFVMRRLDNSQSRINLVRINPLIFNSEVGVYNYEVWYSDLISLLNESWGKLNDTERKEALRMKELLDNMLINFPIHENIIKASTNQRITKINKDNWEKFKRTLYIFERNIKVYMDKHGLSNPNVEGEDFF